MTANQGCRLCVWLAKKATRPVSLSIDAPAATAIYAVRRRGSAAGGRRGVELYTPAQATGYASGSP